MSSPGDLPTPTSSPKVGPASFSSVLSDEGGNSPCPEPDKVSRPDATPQEPENSESVAADVPGPPPRIQHQHFGPNGDSVTWTTSSAGGTLVIGRKTFNFERKPTGPHHRLRGFQLNNDGFHIRVSEGSSDTSAGHLCSSRLEHPQNLTGHAYSPTRSWVFSVAGVKQIVNYDFRSLDSLFSLLNMPLKDVGKLGSVISELMQAMTSFFESSVVPKTNNAKPIAPGGSTIPGIFTLRGFGFCAPGATPSGGLLGQTSSPPRATPATQGRGLLVNRHAPSDRAGRFDPQESRTPTFRVGSNSTLRTGSADLDLPAPQAANNSGIDDGIQEKEEVEPPKKKSRQNGP